MTTAPAPGSPIPSFRTPASTGHTLSLDSFLDKVPLVLLFLPDLSSGAGLTVLGDLDDRHVDFGTARAQVLAVVKETPRAVRRFAEEAGVTVPILADAGGRMIRDFGLEAPEGGARLAAVVADRTGAVVRWFDPLPTDGAAEALLTLVRTLGEPDPQGV